jgi:hypothetical protein
MMKGDKLGLIPLPRQGLAYLQGELDKGKTLASIVMDSVDLDRGDLLGILPKNVTITPDQNLSFGGVIRHGSPKDYLGKMIHEHLHSQDNALVVLQDPYGSPGNSWIDNTQLRVFTYRSEILFLLSQRDINRVVDALRTSSGYPSLGILTSSGKQEHHTQVRGNLSRKDLAGFVLRMQMVFVGAFDNESYVMWRPEGTSQ